MQPQPTVAGKIPLPTPPPRTDAKAIVRQRLAARRQRIRRVRRTVAACALSIFAALWTVLYIQLASGHDPALSAKAAPVATLASATTSSTRSATAVRPADLSSSTSSKATRTGAPTSTQTSAPTTPSAGTANPAAVTTRES